MKKCEWPEAFDYISETGGPCPSYFSRTFAEEVPIKAGETRFLDIGCGSGIIGIFCLIEKKAAFVTFNDRLGEMISVTRNNVDKKVNQGKISASQVDYEEAEFTDIPADIVTQHDLLGFNPPQLPDKYYKYLKHVGGDEVTKSYRSGGADGLDVARKFLQWYRKLSSPAPDAVILLSSFLGLSAIEDVIQENKLGWQYLKRKRVPLRGLFSEHDDEILLSNEKFKMDRSLMKDPNGKWTKELIPILLTHDPQP